MRKADSTPTENQHATDAVRAIDDPFRRLVAIMARLRAPGGCPWDREQTHKTLTPYLIEEAYEVKESLDDEDFESLREELGDLTLQVVFHAQLAREEQRFEIDDVLTTICDKLIRRHPHVFGDVEVAGSGDVLRNWEEIKKSEKRDAAQQAPSAKGVLPDRSDTSDESDRSDRAAAAPAEEDAPSILGGVPRSLPALLKAHRIQEKVATVGFDWATVEPIWDKIHEEIEELQQALEGASRDRVAEEIGDLLFSIVNLSRRLGVPAEEALDMTNRKFMARFRRIEQVLHARGQSPSELSLDELDEIWESTKTQD